MTPTPDGPCGTERLSSLEQALRLLGAAAGATNPSFAPGLQDPLRSLGHCSAHQPLPGPFQPMRQAAAAPGTAAARGTEAAPGTAAARGTAERPW